MELRTTKSQARMYRKNIPNRMDYLRRLNGMRIIDVAKLSGLNMNLVYDYFKGRKIPGIENIILLSEALDVTLDQFMGLTKIDLDDNKVSPIIEHLKRSI